MGWLLWILFAEAPTICWAKPSWEVFCNAPQGYTLVARDGQGNERIVDSADAPTWKVVALDVKDGETVFMRVK